MKARTFVPSVVLLTLLASASRAPAEEAIETASSVRAEDFVGSIADLQALAEEALKAKWLLTKAAKVEGLTLTKDVGKVTLDGYVFLREPVRGLTT